MNKKMLAAVFAASLCCVPLAACGQNKKETSQDVAVEAPAVPEIPEVPAVFFPARAEYVMVCANGLNVRTGAGSSYTTLGQVEKGVLLHFDGEENGWYRTQFRGRAAYVSASPAYTSIAYLDEGEAEVERVISEGLKVLGVPYVYGATRYHDGKGNLLKGFSTDKFDCSSLMQYIFYRGAGVLLDVTTRTQILQGKTVKRGDLKRGDLMFFTNASRKNNTGIERVGHVALYLGDNYILHTASDYAKIEQISPTRWSYFIEGKRVL